MQIPNKMDVSTFQRLNCTLGVKWSTTDLVPRLILQPGDYAASHVIGNIHLRQQRVQIESCDVKLPYITTACISTQGTLATEAFGENKQWQHSNSHHRYFMFRWSSLFDKSGFIVEMENNG